MTTFLAIALAFVLALVIGFIGGMTLVGYLIGRSHGFREAIKCLCDEADAYDNINQIITEEGLE